jgi:Arc/MetJ-type ribon-helix-helix transcriptional regulator
MASKKFSISVDEKTYNAAVKVVESGEFRNLSHVFERGVQLLLRGRIEGDQENPCEASLVSL